MSKNVNEFLFCSYVKKNMSQNFNPYDIMGVSKSATDDEIKRAYRKLSKQHHPDLNKDNPDAEKKFKEINAAYQVLGDKQKRQQYDQFGAAGFGGGHSGQGGGGGFGGFDFSGAGGGQGFADIFETFFGGGGGFGGQTHQRSTVGQDLEVQIKISFEEAVFGTDKEITLTKHKECNKCNARGHEEGSKPINCDTCRGAGQVSAVKNTILGQIRTQAICDRCKGQGKYPERPCSQCHGEGRVRGTDVIKAKVPAGVSNGTTLRMTGRGGAGASGSRAGDLYIHIMVERSREFERRGDDIYTTQKIHVLQAILGDEIPVKTIHGSVTLKIPTGTESGQSFRIKNEGVTKLNASSRGDHYISIELEIPKKLMAKEKDHYMELAKLSKLSTKSKDKGFFDKLFGA
jgi:molecular chaperone DnaJ